MKKNKIKLLNIQKRKIRVFLLIFVMLFSIMTGAIIANKSTLKQTVDVLMKYGSNGEDVKALQQKLKNIGYYTGNVDGIYGSKTKAAVVKYQKDDGLTADGIAGPKTLASLGLSDKTAEGSAGSEGGGTSSNRENDLQLLARMISAEARGESFEGQIAVGAVIMNRVEHPTFPNTISGVIYQPGAFSALDDGQFYEEVQESARRAAENVMNGMDNTSGAIYYYNPDKTTNAWMLSRPVIVVIGKHRFCS